MVLGPLAGKPCPPLSLGVESLTWVQSIKYLGVHIVSARRLTFDINPIKRAFFVACNTICVTKHSPAPTTARAIGHLVAREPLFRGIQLLGPQ